MERVEDFHIIPEFTDSLRVARERGYRAVVVSNQRCISTGLVSLETVEAIHARLVSELAKQGLDLTDIYFCPHGGEHPDRKPAPGMLLRAAREHGLDLKRSWMVGDSERDVLAGKAAGCMTVLIGPDADETSADFRLGSMRELPDFLRERLPEPGS